MLGLLLAFACALAWASFDVFRKQLGRTLEPLPLLVLLNVGLLPVFAIWWGIEGGTITDLPAYAAPAGLALALQVVANLLFLAAVRVSPLSLTIPFLSLTPVFATLVGFVLLDESPTPAQLVGIGLVVGGALTLGSLGEDGRVKLLQTFVRERGAWMMIGVSACWGVTSAVDKYALAYATVPIHALVQLCGVILAALVFLTATRRLSQLAGARPQLGRLALATLAGATSLGLQLVAVQHVFVSQLETIKRAVGLVSAIVLGRLIFDEAITRLGVLAVLVMIAGVTLLIIGA
jgi:drug/metabolite transporter (DMT)-like permease